MTERTGFSPLVMSIGESRRPSSYIDVAAVLKPPGTGPPMSKTCAASLSTNAGLPCSSWMTRKKFRSPKWMPPRNASLQTSVSPGPMFSIPYSSSTMFVMCWWVNANCVQPSVTATISVVPSSLTRCTHTPKSIPSRMMFENELRSSVPCMWRVASM